MVIGLLATVFALVIVFRRSSSGTPKAPAGTAPASVASSARAVGPASSASTVEAAREAEQIRARAESEAAAIVGRAQDAAEQAAQGRREVEDEIRAVKDEIRELRSDLERRENRLADREQRLDKELRRLEDRSAELDERHRELDGRAAGLDRQDEERTAALQRVAGLTAVQAKTELVSSIENQAKREAVLIIRDIEHQARSEGEKRARKVVSLAIQRVATEQTSESVVSVLHLPGDEMKGRIIGREGRNIRAFESVPASTSSSMTRPRLSALLLHPVRREIARLTLERLVLDGRIHPQRIEEAYERGRPRSSSYACGPVRTPWSSWVSPGCTANWCPCSGGCATAPPTGRRAQAPGRVGAHRRHDGQRAGQDAGLLKRCTVLHDIGKALTTRWRAVTRSSAPRSPAATASPTTWCTRSRRTHEVEARTVEAVLTQAADASAGAVPGPPRVAGATSAAGAARADRERARGRREGVRDAGGGIGSWSSRIA